MNTELSTSPSPLSRNIGQDDDRFLLMTDLLVRKGKNFTPVSEDPFYNVFPEHSK